MVVSKQTIAEVERALEDYYLAIEGSELTAASKAMYLDFADCFVRWLKGEFQPGIVKSGWKRPASKLRLEKSKSDVR